MRILVHGSSLAGRAARLRNALAGLAGRGHDVRWLGGEPPPFAGVEALRSSRETQHWRAELVAGAGAAARVAWLGRRAHAGAMMLELRPQDLEGGSPLDTLAWHALPSFGIANESDADGIRRAGRHLSPEHVALWPQGEPAGEPDAAHPDTDVLERACERLLALRSGRYGRPAVFLDRDGTLIAEEGYLSDPARLRLLPGVARALRHLHEAGFVLAVVSNQSGVGRGLFTLGSAYATMARLRRVLRDEGVELDAIRFCPHAPEDGCACRKPGTALLQELSEDLRLSLAGSVMVGDKRIDAATGRAAGGTGLLVRTGYGREEEALRDAGGLEPDAVFEDLPAAASWILERHEVR